MTFFYLKNSFILKINQKNYFFKKPRRHSENLEKNVQKTLGDPAQTFFTVQLISRLFQNLGNSIKELQAKLASKLQDKVPSCDKEEACEERKASVVILNYRCAFLFVLPTVFMLVVSFHLLW